MKLAEIKQNIKKLRNLKGFTQEQMALNIGMKTRNYIDLENDISKDIPITQLHMIAQTLEMSLASLVGFDEKVLFDNCKAEGTYAANCVHYTIHETSKLHEKVHQEKDARIAFLEKQLQSNNQTHEKQVASLERQLDEKQLIINKLLGK
jgi:transcriptional regulator with XRE-family HTH domain